MVGHSLVFEYELGPVGQVLFVVGVSFGAPSLLVVAAGGRIVQLEQSQVGVLFEREKLLQDERLVGEPVLGVQTLPGLRSVHITTTQS